jgi:GT2 family glycosyltransferase
MAAGLVGAAAGAGGLAGAAEVVAVVVTRGRSEYLPRALVALAAQSAPPDAVILVDAGPRSDPAIAEMAIRCGIDRQRLTVVHALRAKNFGQAAAAGLFGREAGDLIWLLHDDSYPTPDCLANLLAAVELAPSVAVAGPKQVRADDPGRLGEVGVTTTPLGRRLPHGQDGELDQGQYDRLDDVLAVGSAGMLVRADVWHRLGGFAPALGPFRDGLEFCRRARLAGHRVVVEPTAVLEHEQAAYRGLRGHPRRRRRVEGAPAPAMAPAPAGAPGTVQAPGAAQTTAQVKVQARAAAAEPGDGSAPAAAPVPAPARPADSTARSYGARRRAFIFTELVDAPLPLWPLVCLAALAAGVGRFVWRIASKDFRLAVDEIWSPVAVLTRFDAVARARHVARRTRRLPRRRLAPLMISAGEARQARRDRRVTEDELRRRALAPTEIEMAEQHQLALRRRRMLVAVTLVTLAVGGAALYRLIGPGFLTGGALGLQEAAAADLARLAGGGWLVQGLGQAGPGDPFNAVLALMTLLCLGDGATAVKLMLVAAPLVGVLGAWFAAGAAARSVWIRAWVCLFYLAAPSFWLAVSDGRLGAAVTHAALPWALLGLARAIGVNRLDIRPAVVGAEGQVGRSALVSRPGSVAAAAFAGLVFAVAAAGSPSLLAPGLVGLAAVCLVAGRGRRLRLVWSALPALALFAPLIWGAARDGAWRSLLADPGPVLAYDPAPFWLQLLGWPRRPVLPEFLGSGAADLVAAGVTAALVVAAGLALIRPGRRGRAVRCGWLAALAGAAAIFGLNRVAVSVSGLEPVTAWSGGAADLVLAGLLVAAAVGFDGLVGEAAAAGAAGDARRRVKAALAAFGVAVLAAGPLAGCAIDVWQRWHNSEVRRAVTSPMPPIVAAEAEGPLATYAVTLRTDGAGAEAVLHWDVVRGSGRQMSQSDGIVGGRRLTGLPGTVEAADRAVQAIDRELASIAARNPGEAAAELSLSGIGFVLAAADDADLAAALDATPGLTRVREGDGGAVVWRVAPAALESGPIAVDAAARLHVLSPDGEASALESGAGAEMWADLPAGPDGRRLILAERADPGWRASLDGVELEPVAGQADEWRQSFELPAGEGRLRVWHAPNWPLIAGQVAVLALAGLLALPIRRSTTAPKDN